MSLCTSAEVVSSRL